MPSVSVVIPTLNAAKWLPKQLQSLHKQVREIAEIVIIDSQSDDNTCELALKDSLCRLISIERKNFDHGETRDFAARTCQSEYLWFLTQDAIPADENCLEELLHAVQPPDIACAYARQIADENATRIEQLNRLMNYPEQGWIRNKGDIPTFQIRAFFLSNTCCLYKRALYENSGGFQHFLPTNEDMLMAANFLNRGYQIAYCSTAKVLHTHHTTIKQWYQRSFDVGAFTSMYARQLNGVNLQEAGKKYVLSIAKQLSREGKIITLPKFLLICIARYLGNHNGQHYMNFSESSILHQTQNPMFWVRYLHDNNAAYTLDDDQY